MPIDAVPWVDRSDIIRLVGRSTFERGEDYTRHRAVVNVDVELDRGPAGGYSSGSVSATVRGSAAAPYTCLIHLDFVVDPLRFRATRSFCSCPMRTNCKHVAATLLSLGSQSTSGRSTDVAAASMQATATESAAAKFAAPQQSEWKELFSAASSEGDDPQSPLFGARVAPAPATRLGLMFELREQTPRTASRWHGPAARAAAPHTSTPATTRLAVRPVTFSAAGRWIRGSITWANLAHQTNRLSLDPAQQRWFMAFAALQRSSRALTSTVDPDWLTIDDFASSLLWALLAEASELDVALVSSKDGEPVRVASDARLTIDLTRGPADTPADGPVRISPILTFDGDAHPLTRANPIADHGFYGYSWQPALTILLAPTTAITPEQRRLFAQESTEVPADEVSEFLTAYYPRLARSIPVTSSDGSLDLPVLSPGVLVLTAQFEPKNLLRLRWHWDYQGDRMPLLPAPASGAASARHARPTQNIIDPARDRAMEREVEAQVLEILAIDAIVAAETKTGLEAAEFVAVMLPRLQAGRFIRVETHGDRPDYRELTDAPQLTITTVETDHRDWFDLGVLITVEGRSIPFGPLFTALATGRKKLLLVDNSYLSLDHPAFDELLRLIREATEIAEWETGPRISRYNPSLWAEFEDLAHETVEAHAWRASARALRDIDQIPALPVPTVLAAEMRPYQQQGLEWLAFLYRHNLGGILADDMGLGKTLQALSLVAHAFECEPHTRPFLVVAPTSVVSGWGTEAAQFLPGIDILEVTSTQKKSGRPLVDAVAGRHIVITSYALFRLDFDAYNDIEWAALILDEAQFVKNPASKAHRCAVELRAPVKFALTGTPLENSLLDLWAMYAVVAPGLFPSVRRFTEYFVRPIAGRESAELAAERIATLRRRIRPLMLRRTKKLVATELPAKQEQVLEVELSARHREIYDTYLQRERQKLLGLIDDLDRNRFIVFRSLTLLRMLALDASLIDPAYSAVPSAKLDALFDRLEEIIAEGHRALVFSQFTSFLRMAADRLEAAGLAYSYLDGSTTQRPTVISAFRTGDAPVFLISLKAGGFGLNLTEADYVFLLDPWWNPAAENQAIDRTHRIGQTRPVNVYRLVATATIEEKVMALRDRKGQLFDAVMDDDGVFSESLTADDIRGLFDD